MASALLSDANPERRAQVLNLSQVFLSAGAILAPAGQVFPQNSGTVFGLMFAASGTGEAVFPYIFGLLSAVLAAPLGENLSLRVGIGALALLTATFLAIVLLCRLIRPESEKE